MDTPQCDHVIVSQQVQPLKTLDGAPGLLELLPQKQHPPNKVIQKVPKLTDGLQFHDGIFRLKHIIRSM